MIDCISLWRSPLVSGALFLQMRRRLPSHSSFADLRWLTCCSSFRQCQCLVRSFSLWSTARLVVKYLAFTRRHFACLSPIRSWCYRTHARYLFHLHLLISTFHQSYNLRCCFVSCLCCRFLIFNFARTLSIFNNIVSSHP
jgi:hypothetical protein